MNERFRDYSGEKPGMAKKQYAGILGKGYMACELPDLNPIENVWAILQTKLDSMERAKNLKMLENQLIEAWKEFSPVILEKLIAGMSSRIKKCIKIL